MVRAAFHSKLAGRAIEIVSPAGQKPGESSTITGPVRVVHAPEPPMRAVFDWIPVPPVNGVTDGPAAATPAAIGRSPTASTAMPPMTATFALREIRCMSSSSYDPLTRSVR